MAQKVTLIIPDSTGETLRKFANEHELSLSAATTAGIDHYTWLVQQIEKEGYKMILEKEENGKTYRKEIVMPAFISKKSYEGKAKEIYK